MRPRARRANTVADDSGQLMLLTIAYAIIALLLVTVVAGITSVHLQRKALLSLADAAALDAADASDGTYFTDVQSGTELLVVPLTDESIRDATRDYLTDVVAETGSLGVADVTMNAALTGSPDGRTAVVTLDATARLPVVSSVLQTWSGGIGLSVTSQARAPLRP